MELFTYYVLSALAVILSLGLHEYSHARAAYLLGDPTAKNQGRLTVNPLRHLDPIGALCLLFFHFGWARPVPINPRNFKKPKVGFAVTALAGPVCNLVVSFFSAFVFLLLRTLYYRVSGEGMLLMFLDTSFQFFFLLHVINLGLGLFNLIPVPPLDGSRILNVVLPARIYFRIMKYERYIYFGLIIWLFAGDFLMRMLLSVPLIAGNAVTSGIAHALSLSWLLGQAIDHISDLFVSFWELIPFLRV